MYSSSLPLRRGSDSGSCASTATREANAHGGCQRGPLPSPVIASDGPRIKVCVRVRPFISEEIRGDRSRGRCDLCVDMPSKTAVQLVDLGDMASGKEPTFRTFDFDRCYWSHNDDHPHYASQDTLHSEIGETMVRQAIGGYNNCVFAYGQTGSGKSFSVLGGQREDRGLLPRVVEDLFEHFASLEEATCKTLVSFLEIYNEQIRDLLAPKGNTRLEVKHHPVLGTFVPGITEAAVASQRDVMDLVDYGGKVRHISETTMNKQSSRSHCIFLLKTSVTVGACHTKLSRTHLVDLAGSERVARSRATGERLVESASINRSLTTLSRVISALATRGGREKPPFRDSKLTYLLKESLAGNSKTVMLAAISPSSIDYEESFSTLKFAQSVKRVQTNAVCNQVSEQKLSDQLKMELEELREQLLQCEAAKDRDAEKIGALQEQLEEQERLCKPWGSDWNVLLAAERERNNAAKNFDLKELQAGVAAFQELPGGSGVGGISVDSSGSGSARGDDNGDWRLPTIISASSPSNKVSRPSRDRLRECGSALMLLLDSDTESDGDLEHIPLRLSLRCRGACDRLQDLGKHDATLEARELRRRMHRLEADLVEAETTMTSFDCSPSADDALEPRKSPIALQAHVAIDATNARAELVVRVDRVFNSLSDVAAAAASPTKHPLGLTDAATEWISESELRRRLAWLRRRQLDIQAHDESSCAGDVAAVVGKCDVSQECNVHFGNARASRCVVPTSSLAAWQAASAATHTEDNAVHEARPAMGTHDVVEERIGARLQRAGHLLDVVEAELARSALSVDIGMHLCSEPGVEESGLGPGAASQVSLRDELAVLHSELRASHEDLTEALQTSLMGTSRSTAIGGESFGRLSFRSSSVDGGSGTPWARPHSVPWIAGGTWEPPSMLQSIDADDCGGSPTDTNASHITETISASFTDAIRALDVAHAVLEGPQRNGQDGNTPRRRRSARN
eukprot:TRINITY_DN74937_c0_g1_i1.p1 TRINITY_DN74937_c0_g1~~TRINITY_DN74937_c0_g1_i1.p1  ORF type:complete len:969 (+),score=183.13 TRINITY_DN74937_c0_g1_i1:522-3428(+)